MSFYKKKIHFVALFLFHQKEREREENMKPLFDENRKISKRIIVFSLFFYTHTLSISDRKAVRDLYFFCNMA